MDAISQHICKYKFVINTRAALFIRVLRFQTMERFPIAFSLNGERQVENSVLENVPQFGISYLPIGQGQCIGETS